MKRERFVFFSRQNLIHLTGRHAASLAELRTGIEAASMACIYHHTHHYLQQHEFLTPEPTNDFAYWIGGVLLNHPLAERIASIDLMQFHRMQDIRDRIIAVLGDKTNGSWNSVAAPPGFEFHFMEAQTFIFPTSHNATDLPTMRECLKEIAPQSLYYHMFESRLRRDSAESDLVAWLRDTLGETELARQISRLDPYTRTLENLRRELLRQIDRRLEGKSHG